MKYNESELFEIDVEIEQREEDLDALTYASSELLGVINTLNARLRKYGEKEEIVKRKIRILKDKKRELSQ